MKINELHRAPDFWGWVSKVIAAYTLLQILWSAVIVPINKERLALAKDMAERRARWQEQASDLDSMLAEIREVHRLLKRGH